MRFGALWAGLVGGILLSAAGLSSAATSARADASPAPADAVPLKDFACGSKEKPCPLQAWMKSVMAAASSSGDGAKLGAALDKVASKPPPGMSDWATIAKEGADKAKKGDIDGAKESCKKCHDAYKDKYKDEMRDRAWP